MQVHTTFYKQGECLCALIILIGENAKSHVPKCVFLVVLNNRVKFERKYKNVSKAIMNDY